MCEDNSDLSEPMLFVLDMLILSVISIVLMMIISLGVFVMEFFKLVNNINYFQMIWLIFATVFLTFFSTWVMNKAINKGWITNE